MMGGLPCAKVIIDNGNATVQVLSCMNASILLANGAGINPTYAEQEAFMAASNALAAVASKIAARLSKEAGLGGETARHPATV